MPEPCGQPSQVNAAPAATRTLNPQAAAAGSELQRRLLEAPPDVDQHFSQQGAQGLLGTSPDGGQPQPYQAAETQLEVPPNASQHRSQQTAQRLPAAVESRQQRPQPLLPCVQMVHPASLPASRSAAPAAMNFLHPGSERHLQQQPPPPPPTARVPAFGGAQVQPSFVPVLSGRPALADATNSAAAPAATATAAGVLQGQPAAPSTCQPSAPSSGVRIRAVGDDDDEDMEAMMEGLDDVS